MMNDKVELIEDQLKFIDKQIKCIEDNGENCNPLFISINETYKYICNINEKAKEVEKVEEYKKELNDLLSRATDLLEKGKLR
jgi:hypothetical protein